MRRYYYVSNDLTDIEKAEIDLFDAGYSQEQVHILSQQDAELEKRHLHEVNPFARLDILRSGLVGAAIGASLAVIVVLIGFVYKAETAIDWLPFVFLAAVLFFFSTWEGGFYGIQVRSAEFKRFQDLLNSGFHVLMVDTDTKDQDTLQRLMAYHESLSDAGEGAARPEWLIASQRSFHAFVKAMP
ncbi:hypothetical protein [Teredinibacter purpureus]|uniref:hypothetical protein n=1 Tax=Teredinibacter purpureus TaxID=2731756 RepID=UPI0005F875DC|nr:hypothetical protein [Teredinibacter purpureus]